jgi:hypothetical protein
MIAGSCCPPSGRKKERDCVKERNSVFKKRKKERKKN